MAVAVAFAAAPLAAVSLLLVASVPLAEVLVVLVPPLLDDPDPPVLPVNIPFNLLNKPPPRACFASNLLLSISLLLLFISLSCLPVGGGPIPPAKNHKSPGSCSSSPSGLLLRRAPPRRWRWIAGEVVEGLPVILKDEDDGPVRVRERGVFEARAEISATEETS